MQEIWHIIEYKSIIEALKKQILGNQLKRGIGVLAKFQFGELLARRGCYKSPCDKAGRRDEVRGPESSQPVPIFFYVPSSLGREGVRELAFL